MLKVIETPIAGCVLVESQLREDSRGSFTKHFDSEFLRKNGINFEIKQVNLSITRHRGTVRGMHYQVPPYLESKMVRVLKGKILDVCVDLRKNSPTFGQWHGVELGEFPLQAFLIPAGCAHGFQTLVDNCELLYLHNETYVPSSEHTLNVKDPEVAVRWPLEITQLSERDLAAPFFQTSGGIKI